MILFNSLSIATKSDIYFDAFEIFFYVFSALFLISILFFVKGIRHAMECELFHKAEVVINSLMLFFNLVIILVSLIGQVVGISYAIFIGNIVIIGIWTSLFIASIIISLKRFSYYKDYCPSESGYSFGFFILKILEALFCPW